jgi:hypothetical protein
MTLLHDGILPGRSRRDADSRIPMPQTTVVSGSPDVPTAADIEPRRSLVFIVHETSQRCTIAASTGG